MKDDHSKQAFPEDIYKATPQLHILKMADRSSVKIYWLLLLIFILCPLVIDPPLTNWTFPPYITQAATNILLINLVILLIGAVYITFYRKKTSFRLDETGMKIQGKQVIPWQSIKWYNIAIFSSRGVRAVVLKTKHRKIRIVAEDDKALVEFEKDLRKFIHTYNPSTPDYKNLKASGFGGTPISPWSPLPTWQAGLF